MISYKFNFGHDVDLAEEFYYKRVGKIIQSLSKGDLIIVSHKDQKGLEYIDLNLLITNHKTINPKNSNPYTVKKAVASGSNQMFLKKLSWSKDYTGLIKKTITTICNDFESAELTIVNKGAVFRIVDNSTTLDLNHYNKTLSIPNVL